MKGRIMRRMKDDEIEQRARALLDNLICTCGARNLDRITKALRRRARQYLATRKEDSIMETKHTEPPCYICGSTVERRWLNGGSCPVCTNPDCKAPQDDAEAYFATKVKRAAKAAGR